MKTYELTYIISPDISFKEAETTAKDIESFIQSKEGIILKQDNPTAKTLAYTIKKHSSGFVGCIEFQLEPEKMDELQKKLQKDLPGGKILRHMVIIKEVKKVKKERKSRTISPTSEEPNKEVSTEEKNELVKVAEEKERVELKDIEQKIDEILGE